MNHIYIYILEVQCSLIDVSVMFMQNKMYSRGAGFLSESF